MCGNFEMPTHCQSCGETFDLNDGGSSTLWHPGTIICKSCSDLEDEYIETNEKVEELRGEIESSIEHHDIAKVIMKESLDEIDKLQPRRAIEHKHIRHNPLAQQLNQFGFVEELEHDKNSFSILITTGFSGLASDTLHLIGYINQHMADEFPVLDRLITDKDLFNYRLIKKSQNTESE